MSQEFRLKSIDKRKHYFLEEVGVAFPLSVRPSLSFFKIGSLVFSDIVHDDGWLWYLRTDRASQNLGQIAQNRPPKLDFLLFSQVWFISFPRNCIKW